ncbi:hypothetical protein [Microbacterium salsuginis]|uniref:hypothetical protein n=1 Tax=Microbacterium salsuginis TaxID=2722803 RepID=UPI00197B4A10|nr:hypothetical protein [Microbacterium sp. CFH 90308]
MSDPTEPAPAAPNQGASANEGASATHEQGDERNVAPHAAPDSASHGGWAAPSAPPFGVPAAPNQPGGATATARFAPPAGYAAPAGYPAAAGYPGAGAQYATGAPATRGRALGTVALVLALLATVGASLLAAIASFNIGLGTGRQIAMGALGTDFDWSILTPVRDWVLMGEIAFWAGTVIGIWALVQGIVAIATRRGRGAGIAAVVIAAVGPVIFGAVVQGFLTTGFAAGSGIGG